MKTIKNIILVVLFGTLVAFLLYIAPNYKIDENEKLTNLVINYSNVTGRMKGEVIIEDDGTIYISKNDIENYYDKYIYYDKKYDYIVATANDKSACFVIKAETLNINGEISTAKIIYKDDMHYIPISKIEDVYNIDVNYIPAYNTVMIESLNKELITAKTNDQLNIKYKNTEFSKTLEKVESNQKLAIVPNKENKNYNGWTLVRTENGKIGYVKTEKLADTVTDRAETVKENKMISLVWEYFSEEGGKAPLREENEKYEGINAISPAFFYLEKSEVKENIGERGINYITWAKSNNYEIWARVANNNDSKAKMDEFSEWINDYKKRQYVINQIVNYVQKYDLDGINIDFENIYMADKDSLSRFIIELKPQLANLNATLSVDVTEPDGSENWSLCYNRNIIGDVADYIVFMAYDQHGSSSKTAGSVAAYNWVEKNVKKFINQEEVDSNKIILGIPLYTRLWEQVENEKPQSRVIEIKNINKYIPSDVEVQWLEDEKQNYIEYTKNGKTYKMWIENEKSISEKLDLIKKYNLSGAAFWQKSLGDESIWKIVKEKLLE